jgi:hypothetical protein
VKKLKFDLSKKLLTVIISTIFLLGFSVILVCATALDNGSYDYKKGMPTGNSTNILTIKSDAVWGNTASVGKVIIPSGVQTIEINSFINNLRISPELVIFQTER